MSILSRLKRELAVGERGIGFGGKKRRAKKKAKRRKRTPPRKKNGEFRRR